MALRNTGYKINTPASSGKIYVVLSVEPEVLFFNCRALIVILHFFIPILTTHMAKYHRRPVTELHLKIRFLREHLHVNQSDLATSLGISQRAYSKIENNETCMQLDHLESIARFFALPMQHLFVYSERELLLLLVQTRGI